MVIIYFTIGIWTGTIRGKRIEGLKIAGKNGVWQEASAKVEGDKLIVSAKGFETPLSLHFCFNDDGKGNLFSTEGIPVAPFRAENITAAEDH